MKKFLLILLSCLLVTAVFAGCKPKTEEAPVEEDAAEAGTPAAAVETTDIVRLESIDYDEATSGLVLHLTKGTFAPSTTELEDEYTLSYGDTETMTISKDASIDFPMVEDLAKTVTITPDELTEEYLAFVAKYDDKPVFTMTQEGDAVKTLTYFYLP